MGQFEAFGKLFLYCSFSFTMECWEREREFKAYFCSAVMERRQAPIDSCVCFFSHFNTFSFLFPGILLTPELDCIYFFKPLNTMHCVVLLEMLTSASLFLLCNFLFLFFFPSPSLFWDPILHLIHPPQEFLLFRFFFFSQFLFLFFLFLAVLRWKFGCRGLTRRMYKHRKLEIWRRRRRTSVLNVKFGRQNAFSSNATKCRIPTIFPLQRT